MAATSSRDAIYDRLNFKSILNGPARLRKAVNNRFLDDPAFSYFIANTKETYSGGDVIQFEVNIGRNPTIAARNANRTLPLQDMEPKTTGLFPFGTVNGTITARDEMIVSNMGEEKMDDYVDALMDVTGETLADTMSHFLWREVSGGGTFSSSTYPDMFDAAGNYYYVEPGDESKIPLGIKDAVAGNGTDQDGGARVYPLTYGSLNVASDTDSTIKNFKSVVVNGSDFSNLASNLRLAASNAKKGGGKGKVVITSVEGWNYFADATPDAQLTSWGQGDISFDAYMFGGRKIVASPYITPILSGETSSTYWSNSNYDAAGSAPFYGLDLDTFELRWNLMWNLKNAIEKGWNVPVDGNYRTKKVNLKYAVLCNDRRRNWLVHSVKPS